VHAAAKSDGDKRGEGVENSRKCRKILQLRQLAGEFCAGGMFRLICGKGQSRREIPHQQEWAQFAEDIGIIRRKKMLSTCIIEPINFRVNRRFGCFRSLGQTKKSKFF